MTTEEEDHTRAEGNVMWDHKARSEGSLQKLKKARKQVLPCGHQKQPALETPRFYYPKTHFQLLTSRTFR